MLDKLLKRRDEISGELKALDNLIVIYERLSRRGHAESPIDDAQFSLEIHRKPRAVQAAEVARAMTAIRKIIISEGRPMKRGELVKSLEKEGFKLPGTDKNKVLGTNLWRSGRFRAVAGMGYWPKDVSLPAL